MNFAIWTYFGCGNLSLLVDACRWNHRRLVTFTRILNGQMFLRFLWMLGTLPRPLSRPLPLPLWRRDIVDEAAV